MPMNDSDIAGGRWPAGAREAVDVVAQQVRTPLLSGMVPPLADFFLPRAETTPRLADLRPGQTAVLTPGEHTAAAPPAQGGTGKTQLAVEFTHDLRNAQAAELLFWVTGTSREAIIAGYADAANSVGASEPEDDAEVTAARFVIWLARTSRPWALVIDDLADAADLKDLWPSGAAGRVVITTRLPGAALGMTNDEPGIFPVNGFSRREGLSYLRSRLTEYSDQRSQAIDLCEDLDGLPLCLAQASAVLVARQMTCRDYRVQLDERRKHMARVSIAGLSTEVLVTWSLAVECAQELQPAGLAWPAMTLAAALGSHAIPSTVLISPAACGYIIGRPPAGDGPDQRLVWSAITNLARAGLVSISQGRGASLVWIHPSVRTAMLAHLPRADIEQLVLAAADALTQAWPEREAGGSAGVDEQIMRDCASALHAIDGGWLWRPAAHPLLLRTGSSLESSGLASSAVTYWQSVLTTSTRLAGATGPGIAAVQDRLGAAYEANGRAGEAIAVFRNSLRDREQILGPEHPQTTAACRHLAHAYLTAGRPADAVALYQRTVTSLGQQFGMGHPETLAARASLADAYQALGMPEDALLTAKLVLADADKLLGPGHPQTVAARASLADAYQAAGRPKDAIEHHQRLVTGQQALHGPDYAGTIAARAGLASALRRAGRTKDAIAQYQQVLADRRRTEGADHPDTIAALANLAFAYRSAGQLREAIPAYEQVLTDRERVQGPDHRDTRSARANLAAAYQQAGRLTDAIPHYERALADSESALGPGSMETLSARCSLASALYADGRLVEAVKMLEHALADCRRYLPPSHPMTESVRHNLDAAAMS
jgi:tetratricopeptide (TPR) repeat protein